MNMSLDSDTTKIRLINEIAPFLLSDPYTPGLG